MAAGPVAPRDGTNVQRHAYAIARIKTIAANFHQIPILAQIARAPLGICMKAARSQHHSIGVVIHLRPSLNDTHPAYHSANGQQL